MYVYKQVLILKSTTGTTGDWRWAKKEAASTRWESNWGNPRVGCLASKALFTDLRIKHLFLETTVPPYSFPCETEMSLTFMRWLSHPHQSFTRLRPYVTASAHLENLQRYVAGVKWRLASSSTKIKQPLHWKRNACFFVVITSMCEYCGGRLKGIYQASVL